MPPLFQPCGRTLRGVESTSLTQPFPSHLGLSVRPSGTFLRLPFDDLCSFKELRKYYQILSIAQRILIHNLLTAKQRNTRHQTRQKGNKFNALSLFAFGFASIDRRDEREAVNKFVAWVSAKSARHAALAVLPDKKATQRRVGWPRKMVRAMLRQLLYFRASF
jgi:hypothetical protein